MKSAAKDCLPEPKFCFLIIVVIHITIIFEINYGVPKDLIGDAAMRILYAFALGVWARAAEFVMKECCAIFRGEVEEGGAWAVLFFVLLFSFIVWVVIFIGSAEGKVGTGVAISFLVGSLLTSKLLAPLSGE